MTLPNATILTPEDLDAHIHALIKLEPKFLSAYKTTGMPSIRRREGGFLQLFHTIVSQQLSVSAANSIWQRLLSLNIVDEQHLLAIDDDTLKICGLSKQKIRYIKSLASHAIDYRALSKQTDEEVIETLTQVTGIGRWSAEIYLLFSMNRCDIFAANDLALQVASEHLFNLPERPKERAMRTLAQHWSPHRSAAAYLLWSYYGKIKNRQGTNA